MEEIIRLKSSVIDSTTLDRKIKRKVAEINITDSFSNGYPDQDGKTVNTLLLELDRSIATLKSIYVIKNTNITSHRKYIGSFIVFCKKVIRRLLKWLFFSYIDQQNQMNAKTIETIELIEELQKKIIEERKNDN